MAYAFFDVMDIQTAHNAVGGKKGEQESESNAKYMIRKIKVKRKNIFKDVAENSICAAKKQ